MRPIMFYAPPPSRTDLHRTEAALFMAAMVAAGGRGPTYPRCDPTGQRFPAVVGRALDGHRLSLPADLVGEPTLLMVGYSQFSQFDIDRWTLGLQQAAVRIQAYEVATVDGLIPGVFAERIDEGMRRGVPREDWPSVITVYGDAEKVTQFTGNENDLPARVLLLGPGGKVAWFHDEGYSIRALTRLSAALELLKDGYRPSQGPMEPHTEHALTH
jgi:hypothetical protein